MSWLSKLFDCFKKKKKTSSYKVIHKMYRCSTKYDIIERKVKCVNGKIKTVYDVYDVRYCTVCNKEFSRNKIRSGLIANQVYREFNKVI